MNLVFAFTHHTGLRIAEVGFLFMVFAGVWLAGAQMPILRLGRPRTVVAGIALAIGAVLLIIAAHWGRFG